MDTVLGLIGVVIWIVCVIALAASVTWVVVRFFPSDKPPESTTADSG
jgi:hypothetical protein